MKKILSRVFEFSEKRYQVNRKSLRCIIVFLLAFNFILLGIDGINKASDPESWDTTAYLGEANFIKNHGGLTNFISLCFSGKYKQANQHPLYILLITPFSSTMISFFTTAKIISLCIGFVFLVVLYLLLSKKYGDLAAAFVVLAFIMNLLFIEWTTIVACESLLMLFSFLCMYFIMEGFIKNKYWIYAGIFGGLAYLTKGTSIILIPGFLLSTLFVCKLKIFKNKYFWIFFILFGAVSAPLLIRNSVVYQNPFFNVNNYIITYGIDNLDEYRYVTFSPDEGATLWKFESEINNPQSNSSDKPFELLSLVKRIIAGVGPELDAFIHSFNIFRKFGIPNWMFGLITLPFFLFGFLSEKNHGGRIYFISTSLLFFILLSFNPIDRYFLPLVPFIWIYIVYGFFVSLDIFSREMISQNYKLKIIDSVPYVFIAFLALYAAFNLVKKPLDNPLNSVSYSENRYTILNWLRTNLKENEKYTLGPNFNWQLNTGIWILPPQNARVKNFQKFRSFIRKHNVSYVIISSENIGDKEELLKDNYMFDKDAGLIEKKNEEGWKLVFKDQNKPVDYLIYKVN